MNLSEITNKVTVLAKEVGEFIRTERQTFSYSKVEIKGLNDLVSYVDKTSEQKLVEQLETKRKERALNWHKKRIEKAGRVRKAPNASEVAKIR